MRSVVLCMTFIAVLISNLSHADSSLIPDRRKAQFESEFGYAVFPFPYSLPGLGEGLSIVGGAMNINETYTDAYGVLFGGDVKGGAIGIADIHLLPETLIVELGASRINKAAFSSYNSRGMKSDKNDYTLMELADTSADGGRLIATLMDRRLEFYIAHYRIKSELKNIRDKDGNIIISADDPANGSDTTNIVGMLIDLTDDYSDPRRGISLEISRWHSPAGDNNSSEFNVWDYSLSAYLPLGAHSTWAFNFFRSDADVTQQGETDPAAVADLIGLDCTTLSDIALQRLCNHSIENTIANNTYGTAGSLGGFNRLRSYPEGRYTGAHIRFIGTEIRWNLTDEFTPMDLYIFRDVRTSIQIAFFYEIGSVADRRRDLYNTKRASYGSGIRMVTASGVVFRGDLAHGNEGFQTNIFIGYPWEL